MSNDDLLHKRSHGHLCKKQTIAIYLRNPSDLFWESFSQGQPKKTCKILPRSFQQVGKWSPPASTVPGRSHGSSPLLLGQMQDNAGPRGVRRPRGGCCREWPGWLLRPTAARLDPPHQPLAWPAHLSSEHWLRSSPGNLTWPTREQRRAAPAVPHGPPSDTGHCSRASLCHRGRRTRWQRPYDATSWAGSGTAEKPPWDSSAPLVKRPQWSDCDKLLAPFPATLACFPLNSTRLFALAPILVCKTLPAAPRV